MKKVLLSLVASALGFGAFSADAATVYFYNEAGWEQVAAYSWNDGSNGNPGWPGKILTETVSVGGKDYYAVDLDTELVIFNNNKGQQTGNLKVVDGAVYDTNNKDTYTYPIGTIENGVFTPAGEVEIEYAKIYIPVSDYNEAHCFIYSWGPGLFGGWPGMEMEKVKVEDLEAGNPSTYWMIEVDKNAIENQKIDGWKVSNNGNNGCPDITNGTIFQDGYVYHLDGTSHALGEHPETPVVPADYIVSIAGAFNGWAGGTEGYTFTTEDKENFTLHLDQLTTIDAFKVVVQKEGSAEAWYAKADKTVTLGETYTLSTPVSNPNMELAVNATDLTLNFNIETKKFSVTGTQGGEIEIVTSYALFGDAVVEGPEWGQALMTEKDGKWVLENHVTEDGAFGIQLLQNGLQAKWICSTQPAHAITLGEPEECMFEVTPDDPAHGNWNLLAGTYTFTFDPEAMTLVVTGEQTPIDAPEYAKVEIHGQILTSDDGWNTKAMTKNEDGKWELIGKFYPGEFGMRFYDTEDSEAQWIGGAINIAQADTEYQFIEGVNSKNALEGAYTLIYDPAKKTVKMTPYSGEIEEVITYALKGTITGDSNWPLIDLTEESEGIWSWEGDVVAGEFGVAELINGVQSEWYNSSTSNVNVAAVGTYTAMVDGQNRNWKSTLVGNYKFSFNPATKVLTIDLGTGISSISAENGEAIYFNLQGVKIEKPENGLFIEVRNGQSRKVMVK